MVRQLCSNAQIRDIQEIPRPALSQAVIDARNRFVMRLKTSVFEKLAPRCVQCAPTAAPISFRVSAALPSRVEGADRASFACPCGLGAH